MWCFTYNQMVDDEIWKLVGYVISSKYRKEVLFHLFSSPNIPSQIALKISKHAVHVSRAIKELQNKELIYCITPKAKKGRVYAITDIGKKVVETIPKENYDQ